MWFSLIILLCSIGAVSAIGDPRVGEWGSWAGWSGCPVSCGYGTATRIRYWMKNHVRTTHMFTDSMECTSQILCPVNGKWSWWGGWSECTRMCDGGVQTRERKCNEPEPENDGNDCYGAKWEGKQCGQQKCPELPANFSMLYCGKTSFICESKHHCVRKVNRCDGTMQCHDGTDEKRCYRSLLKVWEEHTRSSGNCSIQSSLTVFLSVMLTSWFNRRHFIYSIN